MMTQQSRQLAYSSEMAPSKRSAPARASKTPTIAPEGERLRESASRWIIAHLLLNNARGERVTLEDLGKEIATLVPERRHVSGVVRRYDPSILSRIESGKQEAEPVLCDAMAIVCQRAGVQVDPGWLQFGERCKAPPPPSELVAAGKYLRPSS